MFDRDENSRGEEDFILDRLIEDGVIKADEKEDFRELVRWAQNSTLPLPCPEEVVHIVASEARKWRERLAKSQS